MVSSGEKCPRKYEMPRVTASSSLVRAHPRHREMPVGKQPPQKVLNRPTRVDDELGGIAELQRRAPSAAPTGGGARNPHGESCAGRRHRLRHAGTAMHAHATQKKLRDHPRGEKKKKKQYAASSVKTNKAQTQEQNKQWVLNDHQLWAATWECALLVGIVGKVSRLVFPDGCLTQRVGGGPPARPRTVVRQAELLPLQLLTEVHRVCFQVQPRVARGATPPTDRVATRAALRQRCVGCVVVGGQRQLIREERRHAEQRA